MRPNTYRTIVHDHPGAAPRVLVAAGSYDAAMTHFWLADRERPYRVVVFRSDGMVMAAAGGPSL